MGLTISSILGNLEPFNDLTSAPDGIYFTQTTGNQVTKFDYETHEFTSWTSSALRRRTTTSGHACRDNKPGRQFDSLVCMHDFILHHRNQHADRSCDPLPRAQCSYRNG
ncbi:hypothetical protein KCV06_g3, partial [Aureobasidium melanogenum]